MSARNSAFESYLFWEPNQVAEAHEVLRERKKGSEHTAEFILVLYCIYSQCCVVHTCIESTEYYRRWQLYDQGDQGDQHAFDL